MAGKLVMFCSSARCVVYWLDTDSANFFDDARRAGLGSGLLRDLLIGAEDPSRPLCKH